MTAAIAPNRDIEEYPNEGLFSSLIELTRVTTELSVVLNARHPYQDHSGKYLVHETVLPQYSKDLSTIGFGKPGKPIPPVEKITKIPIETYGKYMTLDNRSGRMTKDTSYLMKKSMAMGQVINNLQSRLLARTLLGSQAQIFCVGGELNKGQDVTSVSVSDLDRVCRMFSENNAEYFSAKIDASTGFDTTPVPPAYIAFAPYAVISILEKLPGWTSDYRYSQNETAEKEMGSLGRIRFISTNALDGVPYGSNGQYLYYPTIFCAKDCIYGLKESYDATVNSNDPSVVSNDIFTYTMKGSVDTKRTDGTHSDPFGSIGFLSVCFDFAAALSTSVRSIVGYSLVPA